MKNSCLKKNRQAVQTGRKAHSRNGRDDTHFAANAHPEIAAFHAFSPNYNRFVIN
jgi:hypothetical protein